MRGELIETEARRIKEEGFRIGYQEGYKIGLYQAISQMLQNSKSEEYMLMCTGLSSEQLHEFIRQIKSENDESQDAQL